MFDNNVYVLCRKKLVGNMLITPLACITRFFGIMMMPLQK